MNWLKQNWKQLGVALLSGVWLAAWDMFPQYHVVLTFIGIALGGAGLHINAITYKIQGKDQGEDNAK